MEITKCSDNIRVKGHWGTWYCIDQKTVRKGCDFINYYLMEHEDYGDETPCVIVDKSGNVVIDSVYNGFDDLDKL